MILKSLRLSGSRYQATVVVGKGKYGADVTVQLDGLRSELPFQDGLAQHLLVQAMSDLSSSIDRMTIEEAVQARLKVERAALAQRVQANAEEKARGAQKVADRELRRVERELHNAQRENERLRQSASATTTTEAGQ